jgi:isocitrate lyase
VKKPVNKWSDADRRAFQDGVRLRAQTIPNKKLAFNKSACRKFKFKNNNKKEDL